MTVSSEEKDEYLERVKAEIRAEANAARARAPLPRHEVPAATVAPVVRADGIERHRLEYTINELTGTQYTTFVDQAFRALLKRPPDEAGAAMQVRLLAGGASKAEVLGNLRWSPEGRRVGTRVRGLLPRYVQAKLARVPVFGYLFDWGLALAGLPMLLRHQRAADTSVAARFDAAVDRFGTLDGAIADLGAERERRNAVAEAQRDHALRLDELTSRVDEHERRSAGLPEDLRRILLRLGELEHRADVLRNRADATERRAVALEGRLPPLERHVATLEDRNDTGAKEMIELRHYVHAANHWIVSLQNSIESLEEVATAERAQADTLLATLGTSPDETTARAKRNAAWAGRLSEDLDTAATALDLASGDGSWLEALTARIPQASGVEANHALAARASARGVRVATGDALTALSRCADAALDAVTFNAVLLAGDDTVAIHTLTEILRVLKPGGHLLMRVENESHCLTRAFDPDPGKLDAPRCAAIVRAVGFADAQVVAAEGAAAVFARRPAT